jgi:hypothetical protein
VPIQAQKGEGGFDIAVLTHEKQAKPLMGEVLPSCQNDLTGRLFLLSKDSLPVIPPNIEGESRRASKPNRTANRKHVTHNDEFIHNGKTYKVNPAKSGLYIEITKRIIEQFEIAASKWSRVFVLRFDLHQGGYTSDNKRMTEFRKRLFQKLKRVYGFKEIGFCWVREQERSKSQHYHWSLFLDGNLIRHSSKINEMVKAAWLMPNGNFHVPTIKHPFHFVDGEQVTQEAIYRLSYLAKPRGKGCRPNQTKDYQTSRLKRSEPALVQGCLNSYKYTKNR